MEDKNNFSNLFSEILSDKINIDIICLMYDNQLSTKTVSALLDLDIDEIKHRMEILLSSGIISKLHRDYDDFYYLTEPKVCDSILMLKDAVYRLYDKKN